MEENLAMSSSVSQFHQDKRRKTHKHYHWARDRGRESFAGGKRDAEMTSQILMKSSSSLNNNKKTCQSHSMSLTSTGEKTAWRN